MGMVGGGAVAFLRSTALKCIKNMKKGEEVVGRTDGLDAHEDPRPPPPR